MQQEPSVVVSPHLSLRANTTNTNTANTANAPQNALKQAAFNSPTQPRAQPNSSQPKILSTALLSSSPTQQPPANSNYTSAEPTPAKTAFSSLFSSLPRQASDLSSKTTSTSNSDLSSVGTSLFHSPNIPNTLQATGSTAHSASFFTPHSTTPLDAATSKNSNAAPLQLKLPGFSKAASVPSAAVGNASNGGFRLFSGAPSDVTADSSALYSPVGDTPFLHPRELADLMVLPPSPSCVENANVPSDTPRQPPLLIDLRTIDEFQSAHLLGSFNVNLPTLLVKRYRRGSFSNFNLESFLTTPEAKLAYAKRQVSNVVVVFDATMDELKPEEPSWTLLSVLKRDFARTGGSRLYYLKGGYDAFKAWDTTSSYSTTIEPKAGRRERSGTMFSVNTEKAAPRLTMKGAGLRSATNTNRFSLAIPDGDQGLNTGHAQPDSIVEGAEPGLTEHFDGLQTTGPLSAALPAESDEFSMEPEPYECLPDSPSAHEITAVLPNILYLGSDIVNAEMVKELEDLGVKRVLNMAFECMDPQGLASREGWTYKKLHMQDHTNENIEDVFDEVIAYIAAAKSAKEPIYVHCKAGKSRSATVVLAYLVKGEGWTLRHAYDYLRKRRPGVSPNIGFITALMRLEKRHHGKGTFIEREDDGGEAAGNDDLKDSPPLLSPPIETSSR